MHIIKEGDGRNGGARSQCSEASRQKRWSNGDGFEELRKERAG
jgi:hypothetical protein